MATDGLEWMDKKQKEAYYDGCVIKSGVAARNKEGKYWGKQWEDGQATCMEFGPIHNAEISNPKYCTKPEMKTWDPTRTGRYNSDYEKLKESELVHIRRIIITEEVDDGTTKDTWLGCALEARETQARKKIPKEDSKEV
jgi:hypothetical protein